MKYGRSFARRIVRSFLLLAMKKIRRNEERGCFVWKREEKKKRKSEGRASTTMIITV